MVAVFGRMLDAWMTGVIAPPGSIHCPNHGLGCGGDFAILFPLSVPTRARAVSGQLIFNLGSYDTGYPRIQDAPGSGSRFVSVSVFGGSLRVVEQTVAFPTSDEQPETNVDICSDCFCLRQSSPLVATTAVVMTPVKLVGLAPITPNSLIACRFLFVRHRSLWLGFGTAANLSVGPRFRLPMPVAISRRCSLKVSRACLHSMEGSRVSRPTCFSRLLLEHMRPVRP
jgi:hypothetical protein